jgi:hypothetical protein
MKAVRSHDYRIDGYENVNSPESDSKAKKRALCTSSSGPEILSSETDETFIKVDIGSGHST